MPTQFPVTEKPVYVPPGRLTNAAGSDVYYKDSEDVSNKDKKLKAGKALDLKSGVWVLSDESSTLLLDNEPEAPRVVWQGRFSIYKDQDFPVHATSDERVQISVGWGDLWIDGKKAKQVTVIDHAVNLTGEANVVLSPAPPKKKSPPRKKRSVKKSTES